MTSRTTTRRSRSLHTRGSGLFEAAAEARRARARPVESGPAEECEVVEEEDDDEWCVAVFSSASVRAWEDEAAPVDVATVDVAAPPHGVTTIESPSSGTHALAPPGADPASSAATAASCGDVSVPPGEAVVGPPGEATSTSPAPPATPPAPAPLTAPAATTAAAAGRGRAWTNAADVWSCLPVPAAAAPAPPPLLLWTMSRMFGHCTA